MQTNKSKSQKIDIQFLGKPIQIIKENLSIQLEQHCILLKQAFSTWLRGKSCQVHLKSVNFYDFSTYQHSVHSSALQNLINISPIFADLNADNKKILSIQKQPLINQSQHSGLSYCSIDPALLICLSDHFYNDELRKKTDTFSQSDLRIQSKIHQLIATSIAPGNMWREHPYERSYDTGINAVLSVTITDDAIGKILNNQYPDNQDPDNTLGSSTHLITGEINLFLDHQLIETLISKMDLPKPENLNARFQQRLTDTPVTLNVVLTKKVMSLSQAMTLKAKDIIPIDLANKADVIIGDQVLFSGRIAESDGQLVVSLHQP